MGKRVIISENLARISTNDSTDGEETKRDKAVGWKKALTSAVHKGLNRPTSSGDLLCLSLMNEVEPLDERE
jgi:hypothetical protein